MCLRACPTPDKIVDRFALTIYPYSLVWERWGSRPHNQAVIR